MRAWITHTEEETQKIGAELARELAPDGVLLLSGDLGAGKTVLARGVAQGLGIDPGEVQSPTFTLIREHRGSGALGGNTFVHVDLYRLDPGETERLGLEERLAGPGVKVVEWAERLPFPVPGARVLRLARRPEGGRTIDEITEMNETTLEPGGFDEDP